MRIWFAILAALIVVAATQLPAVNVVAGVAQPSAAGVLAIPAVGAAVESRPLAARFADVTS